MMPEWGYNSGTSGTVTLTDGKNIISFYASSITGGTIKINGGDTITLVANATISFKFAAKVKNPTIVFTGTNLYIVEYVS